jgi:ankyrin repeat protein
LTNNLQNFIVLFTLIIFVRENSMEITELSQNISTPALQTLNENSPSPLTQHDRPRVSTTVATLFLPPSSSHQGVRSLRDLAHAAAPLPFLSFPAELQAMIRSLLDTPSQMTLAQTCTIERNRYTAEQRKWLIFENNCFLLVEQTPYQLYCANKLGVLERCYQIVLSQLLNDKTSDKDCKKMTILAEKFFKHLSREKIKYHLNEVLSKQPPANNWREIFDRLAHFNLHLCVTLITLASPNFDVKKDNYKNLRSGGKRLTYPFVECYPSLASKLQFDQANTTPRPGYNASGANSIKFGQTRAQQFFRQIRISEHSHNTVLHFAIMYGYRDIIPALVQNHPPCIDLPNEHGMTALISLCAQGQINKENIKALPILLTLKANPNLQDHKGNTALMYASQQNDLESIHLLLKHGADINQCNTQGVTALISACQNSNIDTIKLLLAYGAAVNQQSHYQSTALMAACCREDDVQMILIRTLLIEGQACPNLQDKRGLTALMHASRQGNTEAVELLLAHKANIHLQDKEGLTALLHASQQGKIDTARLLLAHPVNINQSDKKGLSALMHASRQGKVDTARLLLTHHVDINQQDEMGLTALMHASQQGNTQIVQLLLAHQANIDLQDKQRMTVLMQASQEGNTDTIRLLLRHNYARMTPQGLADIQAALAIVQNLLNQACSKEPLAKQQYYQHLEKQLQKYLAKNASDAF